MINHKSCKKVFVTKGLALNMKCPYSKINVIENAHDFKIVKKFYKEGS